MDIEEKIQRLRERLDAQLAECDSFAEQQDIMVDIITLDEVRTNSRNSGSILEEIAANIEYRCF